MTLINWKSVGTAGVGLMLVLAGSSSLYADDASSVSSTSPAPATSNDVELTNHALDFADQMDLRAEEIKGGAPESAQAMNDIADSVRSETKKPGFAKRLLETVSKGVGYAADSGIAIVVPIITGEAFLSSAITGNVSHDNDGDLYQFTGIVSALGTLDTYEAILGSGNALGIAFFSGLVPFATVNLVCDVKNSKMPEFCKNISKETGALLIVPPNKASVVGADLHHAFGRLFHKIFHHRH